MNHRLTQLAHPDDPVLYQTGDERPNTGLREGEISHAEINEIIRACPKTVLFGQQTRLRNGVRLPDERLPRFHAGHDMVKFFYSAVRQLPPNLLDAMLDMEISVTLVQGPALLVFHHPREHQSFHIGRTRRTIYVPERILAQAFELGYDYWAITEVLVQESWPLLDYLLLLELVRHCQRHLRSHRTLGYYRIKDRLRRLNKHRLDVEEREEDEFRIFFRYYAEPLYTLQRNIVDRDPYDVVDEIFDEGRERYWAQLKLYEVGEAYNYPAYFALDRDIVHGAAFRIAGELSLPLEPQTPDEVMHYLWDEARFKSSLSLKTEELLEQLISMGAEGFRAFLSTVARELVSGCQFVTANRYDGTDISAVFRRKTQRYSSSAVSEIPGSLGYDFSRLYQHYVHQARCEFFAQYKEMTSRARDEHTLEIKEMLYRVIEIKLHPQRAPDYKRSIDFASSARILIEAGEELLEPDDPQVEIDHLCGLLARLDRHPLYHTEFTAQYRRLSGDDEVVLKENIQPELERLVAYLPDPVYKYSSDPQGAQGRLDQFAQLRSREPDSKGLFTLLAGVFARLDRVESYPELIAQIEGLGDYARPALQEVLDDELQFNDDLRTVIRDTCRQLLREIV